MPGTSEEEREGKARSLMSGMAGTLAIARVITDDDARRRFLDDARQFYLAAVQQ